MKRNVLTLAVILGLAISGCSKIDTNRSLKQSIERTSTEINNAASAIASTNGFQLLTVTGNITKSETGYADSITLALVAGIYDYCPDTLFHPRFSFVPYRLFKKTGTSDKMIVNMPKKIIWHPKYLYNFYHADSAYNHNNFTIAASDYHYYYTADAWFGRYDYKLSAGFTLDNNNLGTLNLVTKATSFADRSYLSKFTFDKGYSVEVNFTAGDTTISSFALSDNSGLLLKETNIFTGIEFNKMGERQYILTIGDVEIKKTTGIDSLQVFLDGVLQKKAAVKIIDNTATTGSICHNRDLQITFDDGTTTNLSTLISPALATLRTLVDSMSSMYFAKNIVDYIAFNIYYHQYKISYQPSNSGF